MKCVDIDNTWPAFFFNAMRVQRKPLAVLAAESLRVGIENGTWRAQLPGEYRLSADLGISRSTLRAALGILKTEGWVASDGAGRRTVIAVPAAARRASAPRDVNILLPVPFEQLPNFAIYWMDALRAQLHSAGCALNFIVSRAFYRETNQKARERLIQQHPASCWILTFTFTKPEMQRWFQLRRIPAVIAGLPSAGVKLPSVGVDSYAIMFHLLGGLTARGHRRIALVTGHVSSIMPLIFRQPFLDTCQQIGTDKINPEVIFLQDESPEVVGREILKALRRYDGPTALVIFNPLHAVTAFSYLPAHGLSIPRDVSIVTTFGDNYLDHLSPVVCRYHYDARNFARQMFEILRKLEMGVDPSELQIRIMLEPIEGKSVGVPRKGSVTV